MDTTAYLTLARFLSVEDPLETYSPYYRIQGDGEPPYGRRQLLWERESNEKLSWLLKRPAGSNTLPCSDCTGHGTLHSGNISLQRKGRCNTRVCLRDEETQIYVKIRMCLLFLLLEKSLLKKQRKDIVMRHIQMRLVDLGCECRQWGLSLQGLTLSTGPTSAYVAHESSVSQGSALWVWRFCCCLVGVGWFFGCQMCFTHILSLATPDTTPSQAQEKSDISQEQICEAQGVLSNSQAKKVFWRKGMWHNLPEVSL